MWPGVRFGLEEEGGEERMRKRGEEEEEGRGEEGRERKDKPKGHVP